MNLLNFLGYELFQVREGAVLPLDRTSDLLIDPEAWGTWAEENFEAVKHLYGLSNASLKVWQ